ncbi:MAG: DUF6263 family protein [Planctomycetes bacterium]|nr:DUF6263 family protein [Planctomycetota bacterium]
MKRTAFAACAFAALVSVLAAAQDARREGGSEKVRLSFRKGDRADYRVTSDKDQSTKMGPADMKTTVHRVQEFSLTVEEVAPDGSAWVGVRFGAVRGKLDDPRMGEVEFDSTKPPDEEDPMGASLKPLTALAGKSFRLRVTADGKISEVRGASEATKGEFDKSRLVGAMQAKALESAYSDEHLAKTLQAWFPMLSADSVAIGDSWPVGFDMPPSGMGFDIAFRGTSQLDKLEADEVVVTTKGVISKKEEAPESRGPEKAPEPGSTEERRRAIAAGMKIEKGDLRTTYRQSRKDGLPLGSTTESQLDMTLPDPREGEGPGAVIRVTAVTKATLERTPPSSESPSRPASRRD